MDLWVDGRGGWRHASHIIQQNLIVRKISEANEMCNKLAAVLKIVSNCILSRNRVRNANIWFRWISIDNAVCVHTLSFATQLSLSLTSIPSRFHCRTARQTFAAVYFGTETYLSFRSENPHGKSFGKSYSRSTTLLLLHLNLSMLDGDGGGCRRHHHNHHHRRLHLGHGLIVVRLRQFSSLFSLFFAIHFGSSMHSNRNWNCLRDQLCCLVWHRSHIYGFFIRKYPPFSLPLTLSLIQCGHINPISIYGFCVMCALYICTLCLVQSVVQ